jgi:hypothetical protein
MLALAPVMVALVSRVPSLAVVCGMRAGAAAPSPATELVVAASAGTAIPPEPMAGVVAVVGWPKAVVVS